MHYIWCGFRMVNKNVRACLSLIVIHSTQRRKKKKQGRAIQEPFWWSLRSAVQWYDIIQIEVDQRIEATLQVCRDRIRNVKVQALPMTPTSTPCTPVWHLQSMMPHHPSPTISLHNLSPTPASSSDIFASCKQSLSLRSCGPILVQRCLACCGGTIFGRSIADGGDIHVATDGNFHHRHHQSAGNSPLFYNPAYFLPKQQVDKMGTNIKKKRKKPCKTRMCEPVVPDDAIDSCEASYEAADGKKQKTSMDSFNDTGLMALICCHDIPLFFANINTLLREVYSR